MALTKEKELLNVIALSDNTIKAENKITIYEDGTAIASNRHNDYYTPDMDINSIDCEKAKALATVLWTQEVISAYNASLNPQT